MNLPKVKMELTREDGDTHQSSVIREIHQDLPRIKDKYCKSCSTYGYNSRTVTCTCDDNYYHDSAKDPAAKDLAAKLQVEDVAAALQGSPDLDRSNLRDISVGSSSSPESNT